MEAREETYIRSQIERFDGRGQIDHLPTSFDWGELGRAIGRSTGATSLNFDYWETRGRNKAQMRAFFEGISANRSIKSMSFDSWNGAGDFDFEAVFPALVPFFLNNPNFERLSVELSNGGARALAPLATALEQFDTLKELKLHSLAESCELLPGVCAALAGHSSFRKLGLVKVKMGANVFSAILQCLQKPGSRLEGLCLSNGTIDDEMASILGRHLTTMPATLECIYLDSSPGITGKGWTAIFAALQSSSFSLKILSLYGNKEVSLSDLSSVVTNTALKRLNLNSSKDITSVQWRGLFEALRDSVLEELLLMRCGIDDEALRSLTASLADNNTVRSLSLSGNSNITDAGWQDFFSILRNPASSLEELSIDEKRISEASLDTLASALAQSCRLRDLRMAGRYRWEFPPSWIAILESERSSLEKLFIGDCSINDATAVSLARSLANNTRLSELELGPRRSPDPNDRLSSDAWAALSEAFCNASSIDDTYSSNHTLQELRLPEPLPDNVSALVKLNRRNNKGQAARLKMIESHFSEGFVGLSPFVDMESKIVPYALAWMGRDCSAIEVDTHGHFYSFLRSMPLLFDVRGTNKKRQREE